jgi:tRNA G18 (ribose-2'-O)-methylase SpoU
VQLTHYQNEFQTKTFPITVVCDHLSFHQNVGALFRISEAFGVEKIIFLGKETPLNTRKINKTSRSTHLHGPYELYSETAALIQYLTENNFEIIALEITSTSKPLREITFPSDKKTALLIGNEITGVSEALLAISHQTAHIDMYGKNSSMNVVQATGIFLYEYTSKISM